MLEILPGVGIERGVDCECAPQRAGLGVYEGIMAEICRYDSTGVEGELFVEVLEVDLLPACDKRFGQVRDGV